jgi:hypothetical protein
MDFTVFPDDGSCLVGERMAEDQVRAGRQTGGWRCPSWFHAECRHRVGPEREVDREDHEGKEFDRVSGGF